MKKFLFLHLTYLTHKIATKTKWPLHCNRISFTANAYISAKTYTLPITKAYLWTITDRKCKWTVKGVRNFRKAPSQKVSWAYCTSNAVGSWFFFWAFQSNKYFTSPLHEKIKKMCFTVSTRCTSHSSSPSLQNRLMFVYEANGLQEQQNFC